VVFVHVALPVDLQHHFGVDHVQASALLILDFEFAGAQHVSLCVQQLQVVLEHPLQERIGHTVRLLPLPLDVLRGINLLIHPACDLSREDVQGVLVACLVLENALAFFPA